MARTEARALRWLTGMTASPDETLTDVGPLPSALLGLYVNGGDTLEFLADRGTRYRYGRDTLPARLMANGQILIGSMAEPQQVFMRVRGRSGRPYLHDGLSAFLRVRP